MDMIRINNVDSAPNCARVWHMLASSIPNAATANAVHNPITANPGRWLKKSSLNAAHPHRNIATSCTNASSVLNNSFPASSLVIVTRVLSTRSSVPLSASSSSAPADPLAVNIRNITPIAAA